MASVAIFCPQSKGPGERYLNQIHSFICQKQQLEPLIQCILGLKEVWTVLTNDQREIATLGQWPQSLQKLSEWIITGKSFEIAKCMSGMTSLPLLVVIQICQYFQYLEICGLSHPDCIAQLQTGGGIQGYCGGLLAAFAIACSRNEGEIVANAAVAIRIALAIGACGEVGDDKTGSGGTTIVVRTKHAGQGHELIEKFPGSYVSAITDPKTVSIVGPAAVLQELQSYAREQGLLVQEMHIRGKVHNPENSELAEKLCRLCEKTEILHFPHVSNLQVPVRSNKTGDLIVDGSLTREVVTVILTSRCEWYTLLTEMAKDLELTARRVHTFATFGIGDCTPLSPFHKLQLQITKVDVQSLVAESLIEAQTDSLEQNYSPPKDAIAITGASCRLPGANSLDELWSLISNGHSRHMELPTDRFNLHGSFRASQDSKFMNNKKFYGNFIDQVDRFDHAFFRINPKEAVNMDPQQRVLLELVYQALDSSGYLASHRRESEDLVGCFIGASFAEYLDNTNAYPPTAYTSTGTIRAFLCGRISHYFGWRGPSEVLDTACSSSLVAINRACKAIQGGECTMAVAGGVNIITGINNFLDLSKAGFLSPTGQCKPFDDAADGYCRSEGGGLVVLKPFSQALVDGDQILGVIPGIATNQGGLSSAITVPHAPAQRELYQTVLNQAGMKPAQVTYVEAHGTGTQAGDPVEIASVREVFGVQDRTDVLNIGSLKGNIGHTETAAGVASLLKILAMINNASIPPQASHNILNRKIAALGMDKMCIASRLTTWRVPLLAACVNSYGAAGSNCAMICCEGPRQKREAIGQIGTSEAKASYPIIMSAASQESLFANVKSLRQYLQAKNPKPKLEDIAFTLSERRQIHRHVFITSTPDVENLVENLKFDVRSNFEVPKKPKSVVLAFGGQSKGTVDMDRNLYDSHPLLRNYIDECEKIVTTLGFPKLLPSIFQSEPISDIVTLQCGTFAMQYAYAKCWIDAGLRVDATVGHSFGELTAMAVSGTLSLFDGLKLVASRASLMATKWGQEKGTMLAIHGNRNSVQDVIASINADSTKPEIEIACYNAPSSQVVVGNSFAISRTENRLRTDPRFSGIRSQRLDVNRGFHSKFTQPILDDIDHVSASLSFCKPTIPLETCTANTSYEVSETRPSQHAREPVHFMDAIQRLEQRLGSCVWLEAGLGSPIVSMVKRALKGPDDHSFQAYKISDFQSPMEMISNVMTNLWREGISVSYWKFLQPKNNACKQIWLPPYQFQRATHWLKNVDRVIEMRENTLVAKMESAEKGEEPKDPSKLVSVTRRANESNCSSEFKITQKTQRFAKIVSGHAVRQRPLCPASMYMECAAMGLQLLKGPIQADTFGFLNLSFHAALGVDPGREISLTIEESGESGEWSFVIKSTLPAKSNAKLLTHAKGKMTAAAHSDLRIYQRLIIDRMNELQDKQNTEKLMSNRAYGLFSQVVHYAEFLRGIKHIIMEGNEAIAKIDIPEQAQFGFTESIVAQYCDTIAIDTFIQVVGLLINSSPLVTEKDVFVATGVDAVSMSSACDFYSRKSWIVYAKYTCTGEGHATGDIFVMTPENTLALMITGAQFTKLLISKLEKFLDDANAKPFQEVLAQAENLVRPPVWSSKTSDMTNIVEPKRASSGSDHRTIKNLAEYHKEDANSEIIDDDAEGTLRSIVASYTGLSPVDITQEMNMSDIGVDSLAAVELAEELQTKFGKEIAAENLLASSYGALSEHLLPLSGSTEVKMSASKIASTETENFTPPSSTSQYSHSSISSSSPSSRSSVEINDSSQNTLMEFTEVVQQEASSSPVGISKSIEHMDQDDLYGIGKICHSESKHYRAFELASLIQALTECDATFEQAAAKCGYLDYWATVAPKQHELLLAYICEAFQALGSDLGKIPKGEQVPPVPILPKHGKVMNQLTKILESGNILIRQGSNLIRSNRELSSISSRELHEDFLEQFPTYAGEARLMALTGPKLADCLTGKIDPLTLLFRGAASQKIMEDYYCASPMLSTLTEQLVKLIRAILPSKNITSSGNPIRILEVGAGFGGTTTRLAEMLQESGIPVQYNFSDISPSLVKGAKSKFSKFPWMNFQVLNLENDMPVSLQNTYDLIIGTNCVHATTNKAESIRRLKSALNSQGSLVLSEVTQIVDWYDIVFGLLDGWWLAEDGSDYPLQPPESWARCFQQAGFSNVAYSQGQSLESNTQRLFVASEKHIMAATTPEPQKQQRIQTAVYKQVDDIHIEADIYLPAQAPSKAMPVALMIHGGGYMTLSKKAIRPSQTSLLLAQNILPVSIDYRLCPEINMLDGPITDVCDAYAWAQSGLQNIVSSKRISIDEKRIVVIGWSSGGHLAMTTAWKTKERGLIPPAAILSFYGPTDFESGDLDFYRAGLRTEEHSSIDSIISSLPTKPITSHSTAAISTEKDNLGWLRRGDPHSDLVLSLFNGAGHGLPLLLNGIHPSNGKEWFSPPSFHLIAAISPLWQVRQGKYTTPTFLIHGTQDEIVPYHTAVAFHRALLEKRIPGGLATVNNARHMHDLKLKRGDEGFLGGVEVGYRFLFEQLRTVGSLF